MGLWARTKGLLGMKSERIRRRCCFDLGRGPQGPARSVLALGLCLAVTPAAAMPSVAASTPQPENSKLLHRVAVFGSDERKPLAEEHRDLADKIGLLIDGSSNAVCSAFCASDDVVVTASHCLFRTSGSAAPDLKGFVFRLPGNPQSRPTGIAGAETDTVAYNVSAGSEALITRPPIGASQDWALVRLAAPACRAGGLKLHAYTPAELTTLGRENRLYQVGFHRDLPGWHLAEDHDCAAEQTYPTAGRTKIESDFANPGDLILHTCDTGGGSSGSPLLVDGPDGPEAVGINVGTYVQSRMEKKEKSDFPELATTNVANTAVAVPAFQTALREFAATRLIATRSEMKELQSRLAALALYRGPLDGVYRPAMQTAISNYEQQLGQPVTGLATADLLVSLGALAAAKPAGQPRPDMLPSHIETSSIGSSKPSRSNGHGDVQVTGNH